MQLGKTNELKPIYRNYIYSMILANANIIESTT